MSIPFLEKLGYKFIEVTPALTGKRVNHIETNKDNAKDEDIVITDNLPKIVYKNTPKTYVIKKDDVVLEQNLSLHMLKSSIQTLLSKHEKENEKYDFDKLERAGYTVIKKMDARVSLKVTGFNQDEQDTEAFITGTEFVGDCKPEYDLLKNKVIIQSNVTLQDIIDFYKTIILD